MIITKIYLRGFKNFKNETSFKFDKINLIQGENGSGKSTLAIDSLLFALFGYSSQSLEKLVTRSLKNKECTVRVEIEDKGKKIIIDRRYPTSLTIYENGIALKFQNTKESQEYVIRLFNNLEWFRKFRMVDSKEGINILEEGRTSLKKTLLSLQENWFNEIRQKLLNKKAEREMYNKDKCVWKHFPSTKRLKVLQDSISTLLIEADSLSKELHRQNDIIYNIASSIGKLEGQETFYNKKIKELETLNVCPTCTQKITEDVKNRINQDLEETLTKCLETLKPLKETILLEKEVFGEIEKSRKKSSTIIIKLRELEDRLKVALRQKDFKYTQKDVLIINQCIKELDNFYGYFITEWIKTLEPIINSVLDKIGFKISFQNDFELVLEKDGETYSYKDLSTGQKLILSIALKLAILLERNEKGILIADEGLSSLDETNLNYIMKLFSDLPFQLIAIIHRFETEQDNINIISL